jgi:hypothetical protein
MDCVVLRPVPARALLANKVTHPVTEWIDIDDAVRELPLWRRVRVNLYALRWRWRLRR